MINISEEATKEMNHFPDIRKKVYSKGYAIFNANINEKLKDNLPPYLKPT